MSEAMNDNNDNNDGELTVDIDRWSSIYPLLSRSSPFVPPGFSNNMGKDNLDLLNNGSRILVVGAGGLGCEILKDLALSGFNDISVIDLDTIDVSNLNRQFLFRLKDCNKHKSEVAAKFIMNRIGGENIKVTHYTKPIQEFTCAWYSQFDIVIAGLDNIEARQWLNQTLVDLVKFDEQGNIDFSTVIPFIDGGTEGFGGQARVFLPRLTSCFECSLVSMQAQTGFAVCTIRNVPRIPEHCIAYALKVEWPLLLEFKNCNEYKMYVKECDSDEYQPSAVKLDKDDVEHMSWIFNRASERAKQFNISGVTYNLTMQVVKNIIPAIASTNALISAACVNEAFKFRTRCSYSLDNYFMYMGGQATGTNTETIKYKPNPNCSVCHKPVTIFINPKSTLQQLIQQLQQQHSLNQPSISYNGKIIYVKSLHSEYAQNLSKPVESLFKSGHLIVTADKNQKTLKVLIIFQ